MEKDRKSCTSKRCFLCKNCAPEWVPFVEGNKKTIHFKKGETIFLEGEKVEGIYFLNSGKVKVHKQWNEEKQLIIRFVKEGDVLGHRGFGLSNIYPVSATALESTTVCFIPSDFFLATLKMNHELTYHLLLFYSAELENAEQRMRDLVHMDTKGKISDALLMMKTHFGCDKEGNIEMKLTRQDLSSFVGTTYETVFKIINELVREKSIAVKGKEIKILNEKKLQSYTIPSAIKK
ncbi:MAG: Crp/Fnr family transcriptional regulator [Bacteroidetes bacterium]|nr:Crp/Fnr family transcriptional regulator [Bacteroidota bacterium]